MNSLTGAALATALCLTATAVAAQTTAPPQTQVCRVCHGLDGQGSNPLIPNIGGQSAEYLKKQLQDFRAGRREDPQMSIIAADLTDEDIRAVADWFSSVKASFELPQ